MPRSSSGRTRPAPSNVVEAKVRVPSPPPWAVSRTPLVNRLRAASAPLVTLIAPAGYGKTTLAAQWAERDRRPFAWLSVDEGDDDPALLLRAARGGARPDQPCHAAPSAREAEAVDGGACTTRRPAELDRGHRPRRRRRSSASLPQLDEGALDTARARSARIDAGAGRARHARVADRAASGGREAAGAEAGDLALSRREGEALLRELDAGLADDDASDLLERCEGWAAGIRLSALAAVDRADGRTRFRAATIGSWPSTSAPSSCRS